MGRKCKDVLPFCPISLSSDVHIDLLNVNTGKIKEADKHFMCKKNKKKKKHSYSIEKKGPRLKFHFLLYAMWQSSQEEDMHTRQFS